MEACNVPRVKRIGNLRAAFQADRSQATFLEPPRSSVVELSSYAERAVERVSFEPTVARLIVRQDSFIVSEHHATKLQPPVPSDVSQRLQADQFFRLSGEQEDHPPVAAEGKTDTVHGVTFSFPDAELDLTLPEPRTNSQRASYQSIHFHNAVAYQHDYTHSTHAPPLAVQNHCPTAETTASRRWSQPGDWLYDGEKIGKYHFKHWKDTPDNLSWVWEVEQIDHSPPEPKLQRVISQTVEKLHDHARLALVRVHLRDLPRIPDWGECYRPGCELGCAPKVPKEQV
jgi:hypothetical protein